MFGVGSELADGDGQDKRLRDERLYAPVLRGAQHVLRYVLRQVLHVRPHLRASAGARVCLVWVLSWQMAMGKTSTILSPVLPSFTAPGPLEE